ncbi:MAG TPA: tRNA (adenosine(37)-N6)-threonylcarbamoyltransferase complex ATPase subunit type 1 TsaE [Nitrospirota bacterium]|nr:tRNA (adenosine(37)-N6)-threonylcarbamoyltransferase complex ATPase subunit type 1 TsaE [Nitrospirota bacterium]
MMFSIITSGPEQTEHLGEALGSLLRAGDLICLYGDLGSGKTHFSFGVAMGLEVREQYITSPTFTLVNIYQGRMPFYHIDLYRLKDPSDLENVGLDEYVDSDGATVIEWAERADDELPEERLNIYFSHVNERSREIGFLAEGERYRNLLDAFREKIEEA